MDNGACSYRRFLEGDDAGFVEIIRDYKDGLTLYLNGFAKNMDTAEEWMEDTFFKLVVKKPKFSGRCSFKTWLYTIGRNVAIDHLRHAAKYSSVSIQTGEHCPGNEESLEKAYLKEEQRINLHRVCGSSNRSMSRFYI